MKVRNIKITIKSNDDLAQEVKAVWESLEKGEKVQKKEGIYFENLETKRKVLTEERLRILKVIKKDHPPSIYALAKLLKRDSKNTFDDVNYLAKAGLFSLKKKIGGREITTPVVDYDKIVLEISVYEISIAPFFSIAVILWDRLASGPSFSFFPVQIQEACTETMRRLEVLSPC